ncbi:hypothetical protein MUCCIDRAFT_104774 [Mucor lusitanicus CBS 277.49]|uniref:Uncharacterized protein n=1 Tax=Mucor lusitanicus CBS 277.49 TaxID=747725 RepID=A0A168PJU0_MUCCL|nr:hypothetical protein MUCCIDRAFT_104774 [Mucor lusitanicus CBS 277.49]
MLLRELECVQAKGVVGSSAVTVKLDLPKAKGLPKRAVGQGEYNGVRTNVSSHPLKSI